MDKVTIRQIEPGIFVLTINDAVHTNRLSDALCDQLLAAFELLAHEPALKVLLLAGRADVFCAGATREAIERVLAGDLQIKDLLLPRAVLDFPLPIVGVLEGHAVGGGLALALCCDLTVAARDKRYGMNFTRMGFTPAMGVTGLLPPVAGDHCATEMIVTGRFYRGGDLQARAFFNYVVPDEEVFEVAIDLARRIAERPRQGLASMKHSLGVVRRQRRVAAMAREHLMHAICFARPEVRLLLSDEYLG
jgi:polyketide biosynthesis enoyl-CoA hydratase PksI